MTVRRLHCEEPRQQGQAVGHDIAGAEGVPSGHEGVGHRGIGIAEPRFRPRPVGVVTGPAQGGQGIDQKAAGPRVVRVSRHDRGGAQNGESRRSPPRRSAHGADLEAIQRLGT